MYDYEDEWIDDTELIEYFGGDQRRAKHKGFFINKGDIEREDGPAKTSPLVRKRRRKEPEPQVGGGPASPERPTDPPVQKRVRSALMCYARLLLHPTWVMPTACVCGALVCTRPVDMLYPTEKAQGDQDCSSLWPGSRRHCSPACSTQHWPAGRGCGRTGSRRADSRRAHQARWWQGKCAPSHASEGVRPSSGAPSPSHAQTIVSSRPGWVACCVFLAIPVHCYFCCCHGCGI